MFSERLKRLRKERGITQEQLAAIIGVERSSIGKYEGKSQIIPSDDVKYRIAEYFGVSVDYLLGYTDVSTPINANIDFNAVEIKLIDDFRSLDKEGKKYILQTMAMAVATSKHKNDAVSNLENLA